MRDTANFSVFGGVYPAEAHSQNPIRTTQRTHSVAPLAIILSALVIGSVSGAVAAMTVGSSEYGFMLAGNMEISGVPTLREVLW